MDRFSRIPFNTPKRDYSNFGEDMYGVNVKIPVHSYRSLYSKQPIYYTDYGSGGYPYPVYGKKGWRSRYYAKPEGGGIWAVDGAVDKDAWVSECVKKKLDAIPAGTNFVVDPAIGAKVDCEKEWNDKNSSSAKADNISEFLPKLILPALGGLAGYLIANNSGKNKLNGVLLGVGIVSVGRFLVNQFISPEEKKINANGNSRRLSRVLYQQG